MIIKFIITAVLVFLLFGIFTVAYLRYYEKKSIYFPVKNIDVVPADAGLKYEDIYFDAEDGARLNGWFIHSDEPKGCVLFCHGNAGNIGDRMEIIKILNSFSLNIFIFDYRGYGKSRGIPSEKGLYSDALAAYNYLAGRKGIDTDKIIVYGKSLGANVAVDLAAKVKAAGLVFDGGFSSACDMGKILFPHLPVKWIISIRYDAAEKIKSVKMRKLIIHSINDEIVPFEQGMKVFKAAVHPKKFHKVYGGHNDITYIYGEGYKKEIEEVLKNGGIP